MLDRLTITQALIALEDNPSQAVTDMVKFAVECNAMLMTLEAVSFPLPGKIQVILTNDIWSNPPLADLVLDPRTARLLHAALGAALGVPAPDRLATT